MSPGPDGKANTPDDFPVASFSRDIAEQSGKDLIPQSVSSEPLSGNTGAINGVVTDPTGAVSFKRQCGCNAPPDRPEILWDHGLRRRLHHS